MNSSWRRRRLLINTRYQLSHLAVTLVVNLLLILLMAVLISWFYLLFFKGNIACDHNRLFPFYLVAVTLAVVAGMGLWSLRRSRAIAGMMHKVEQVLRDAAGGKFPETPLVFRKHDYFAALADPINGCLARMGKQEQRYQQTTQDLHDLREMVSEDTGEGAMVRRRIETILAELEQTEKGENR